MENKSSASASRPGIGGSYTYAIDKKLLISRYWRLFFIIFATFAVLIAALTLLLAITDAGNAEHMAANAILIGFLAVVSLPIPIILYGIPIFKIKKNTPEKITLYRDRVSFGDRTYSFSAVDQIKATSPSYKDNLRLMRRVITITTGKKSEKIIVGDSRDAFPNLSKKGKPKVFADYAAFCDNLENALLKFPGKFKLTQG